ncbi:MAG: site-specific DNA-methyltransferase [Duncaniella sp.]|nr:site-specific DNA-methyltransferase [Duncaniella sp.]
MLEKIKNILGEPYYECKYGLLYNMDCEKALAQLDMPCLASTITSPPYNIGKEYERVMPLEEYLNWLSRIATSIEKITLPNGNFILNVGYLSVGEKGRAVPIPYLVWDRIPFYFNQEIIWHYEAGVAAKKYLSPRNEKILWYVKDKDSYTFNLDPIRDPNVKYPNQKKNGKLRCNSIGKNPSDIWEIAKVTSGTNRSSIERTAHPAQFPEDLIRRLMLGFTNQNDLVLDPFMGSGTVGSVSIELKRKFIGFEINPEYCKIAKKRIELKMQETNNLFDNLPLV